MVSLVDKPTRGDEEAVNCLAGNSLRVNAVRWKAQLYRFIKLKWGLIKRVEIPPGAKPASSILCCRFYREDEVAQEHGGTLHLTILDKDATHATVCGVERVVSAGAGYFPRS